VNYFRALLGSDADKFMGGVGVGPIIRSVDLAWRYVCIHTKKRGNFVLSKLTHTPAAAAADFMFYLANNLPRHHLSHP
jgi:hypothetical protein